MARCETRLDDQNRLLEQVLALQKDILHQLQHVRPVPSTREYNFATVDALLPVDTLNAFAALEEKITSDEEFKELLVGTHNVYVIISLIFLNKVPLFM